MSFADPTPNFRAFTRDLREIRMARGISLDAVQDQTKIMRHLLVDFEEAGLAGHPSFNRVYVRAFVRAYAAAVGIPPDPVLDALDQALADAYDGSLIPAEADPAPSGPSLPPAGAASRSASDRPASRPRVPETA